MTENRRLHPPPHKRDSDLPRGVRPEPSSPMPTEFEPVNQRAPDAREGMRPQPFWVVAGWHIKDAPKNDPTPSPYYMEVIPDPNGNWLRWTRDIQRALRFARQQDADVVAELNRERHRYMRIVAEEHA